MRRAARGPAGPLYVLEEERRPVGEVLVLDRFSFTGPELAEAALHFRRALVVRELRAEARRAGAPFEGDGGVGPVREVGGGFAFDPEEGRTVRLRLAGG